MAIRKWPCCQNKLIEPIDGHLTKYSFKLDVCKLVNYLCASFCLRQRFAKTEDEFLGLKKSAISSKNINKTSFTYILIVQMLLD